MANNVDVQYINLIHDVLDNGATKHTRAGETLSRFGCTMRFDLTEGFPLLTTKKVFYKGIIHELLWFLSGSTNIKYLLDNNVHIWDDDAYRYYLEKVTQFNTQHYQYHIDPITKDEFLYEVKNGGSMFMCDDIFYYGELGPVYGYQWRRWGDDQIMNIINTLKTNPDDRRLILNAWNNFDLPKMALPPCHMTYQFYATKQDNGKYALSCMLHQRSADVCCGVPFNIASAALLTHLIAQCADMDVNELIWVGGDVHIYKNQIGEALTEQISRDCNKYDLPRLKLNPEIKDIDKFTFEDIKIEGYESYPALKYPLSVGL